MSAVIRHNNNNPNLSFKDPTLRDPYIHHLTHLWVFSESGPCEGWHLQTRTPPASSHHPAAVWLETVSSFLSLWSYCWALQHQYHQFPSLCQSSCGWNWNIGQKHTLIKRQWKYSKLSTCLPLFYWCVYLEDSSVTSINLDLDNLKFTGVISIMKHPSPMSSI